MRRLAFDSDKIALESLASIREAKNLFQAMGAETANIHLGDAEAADVKRTPGRAKSKAPGLAPPRQGQEMLSGNEAGL